jgi:hypothetical protein
MIQLDEGIAVKRPQRKNPWCFLGKSAKGLRDGDGGSIRKLGCCAGG